MRARWGGVALIAVACSIAACGSRAPRYGSPARTAAPHAATAFPRTPASAAAASLPLRPDHEDEYVANSDGTGLRKLYENNTGAYVSFVPSPDGLVAALVTRTPGDPVRSTLSLVDVATGGRKELLADNSASGIVGWAPDSSRFVFYREQAISPPASGFGVYDLKRGTSGVTPFDGQFIAWAPDSSRFYFWTYGNDSAIYAVDGTSLSMRTLLHGVNVQSAALSRDDRSIAYTVGTVGSPTETKWTIGIVGTDGSGDRTIAQLPASVLGAYGLAWSPNGTQLAYGWTGSDDPEQPKGAYIVNIVTGVQRRVTDPGTLFDAGVAWSPDGRWLLIDRFSCVACDGGGPITVVAAVDGSRVTVLDRGTGIGTTALWSPDGSQFVYNDGRLVVASLTKPSAGTPIVAMASSEFKPTAWTASGQMFFEVFPSRDSRLYAVQSDGSSYSFLGPGESVSPDGMATAALVYGADSPSRFHVQINVDRHGQTRSYDVGNLVGADPVSVNLSRLIWAPDSTQLLLKVGIQSADRLVVLDTRTGSSSTIADVPAPPPLTPGAQVTSIFDVAWSPEGSRVAYSSATAVWTVAAAGGPAQHVLDAKQAIVAWSPDGTQIAAATDGRVSIAAADASGTVVRSFDNMVSVSPPIPLPMSASAMRWSPDGADIAITDVNSDRLLLMNASDGSVRTLANGGVGDVIWSPDSRRLAYGGTCPGSGNPYGEGICLIGRDGLGAVQVTESRGYVHRPLLWRADGTILYASVASGP